jgi:hypothetical protein
MNSANLCSLAGRYNNPIPPRSLAPIDCLKIQALKKNICFEFSVLLLCSVAPNYPKSKDKIVYFKTKLAPEHKLGSCKVVPSL